MAALFDVAFRPDYTVRKSILGFDHDYVKGTATALDAGFGSLYWMEGVAVRLQVSKLPLTCRTSPTVRLSSATLLQPQLPPAVCTHQLQGQQLLVCGLSVLKQ